MKALLVFVAVLVVVAATTDRYNNYHDKTRTRTRSKTDGKHHPVYCPKPNTPVYGSIQENNANYPIGSIIHYSCNYGYELYGLSWNKCVYEYGVAKWKYPVPICKPKAAPTKGYNNHRDKTRTKTRTRTCSKTDEKHHPVYCPKPNPPVYGSIQENNANYPIRSIIHYSCNYGYELYGSSWNKCVYEYGVAKWEYPVPICKPKVYSG